MSGREPRPRRRRKSAASQIRPFWILIVILLVVVAAGSFYAATWPGFYPKRVTVEGNRVVPSNEIVAKAQIASNQNLWLQGTAPIVKRVEEIPYVETAAVRRGLPASATIVVTERVPFAVVENGSDRVVVDHELRVLQEAQGTESLPVLHAKPGLDLTDGTFVNDAGVKALRDDDDVLAAAHIIAAALSQDKFGQLIVTLRSGVRVLLGDDEDIEKKIALIDPILAQTAKAGRHVATLDLRAPNTPVVVYKETH